MHLAFARKDTPAAVHHFAPQGTLVQPAGYPVAEPDEDAFLQRFFLHFTRLRV